MMHRIILLLLLILLPLTMVYSQTDQEVLAQAVSRYEEIEVKIYSDWDNSENQNKVDNYLNQLRDALNRLNALEDFTFNDKFYQLEAEWIIKKNYFEIAANPLNPVPELINPSSVIYISVDEYLYPNTLRSKIITNTQLLVNNMALSAKEAYNTMNWPVVRQNISNIKKVSAIIYSPDWFGYKAIVDEILSVFSEYDRLYARRSRDVLIATNIGLGTAITTLGVILILAEVPERRFDLALAEYDKYLLATTPEDVAMYHSNADTLATQAEFLALMRLISIPLGGVLLGVGMSQLEEDQAFFNEFLNSRLAVYFQ